jgi:hypothetical protein
VRRARLRATLGVDGRSPLGEPCLRNYTQSVGLDALESWLAAHADGDPGFDVASLKVPVLRCPHAARWMDPETWVVRLFDTSIDLHRLVEGLPAWRSWRATPRPCGPLVVVWDATGERATCAECRRWLRGPRR